jgi:hypothetical protein
MSETSVTEKTTTTHTPGPWEVKQGADERDFIVADQTGNTVCEPNAELFNEWPELDPNVHHISVAEAQANARLIAAAPDLLESLKEALSIIGNRLPVGSFTEAKAKALAAIAKAEGR